MLTTTIHGHAVWSGLGRWLLICGGLLAAGATAAQETPKWTIEAFGDMFQHVPVPPKSQARVLAYRSDKSPSGLPINLYLNGRYHASLLGGGYTEFCLQPGKISLQVASNDAGQMHTGKHQPGTTLEPQAGRVIYLKLVETTGHGARLEPQQESHALPELRRTRQQVHTLSRSPDARECSTDLVTPTAPAPVAPLREYALQADALFEFGKAVLKAEGFNAIEILIQQVQQEYSSIDKVRVIGYTDAIGPVALNRKLSTERANTVAERLRARGLKPKSGIEAEGRWSLELAKTGCKDSPTPENKICHAPNRRVVIVIFGARR